MKAQVYKPKSIKEAIDNLQGFFECDLYSKFRPDMKLKKEVWTRTDVLKNEKEFEEYLQKHFDILRDEIKEMNSPTRRTEVSSARVYRGIQ